MISKPVLTAPTTEYATDSSGSSTSAHENNMGGDPVAHTLLEDPISSSEKLSKLKHGLKERIDLLLCRESSGKSDDVQKQINLFKTKDEKTEFMTTYGVEDKPGEFPFRLIALAAFIDKITELVVAFHFTQFNFSSDHMIHKEMIDVLDQDIRMQSLLTIFDLSFNWDEVVLETL